MTVKIPLPVVHEEASDGDEPSQRTRSGLDALAHRYYAPLVSFFRKRARHAPEVQDLVQQVFLRLAQSSNVSELRNPDAYIFQTAANTLRDHYRHSAVRDRFANEYRVTSERDASDFSAEHVILGRERLDQLIDMLGALPDRTRDVIMLRCFEGLKNAEIARLHNISVRAVEKHVAKALAQLSGLLESGEPS